MAFLSAILSGAAGVYILHVTGAAPLGIDTDVTVRPGQHGATSYRRGHRTQGITGTLGDSGYY
jgi:hypothetical protein